MSATLPNAVPALVLVAALLAGILLTRAAFPRALVPVALHNGIWAVVLLVYSAELIDYHEFGATAWATFAVGLAAFDVGAWALSRQRPVAAPVASATPPRSLVHGRGLALLLGAYALGYGAYLLSVADRFGIQTLLLDPESIRGAQGASVLEGVPLPLRLLLHLGPLVLAMLTFPPAVAARIPLPLRVLLAAAVALSLLTLLQRTNVFMGVLLAAALWIGSGSSRPAERRHRRRPPGRPILVGVAAGALLLGAFQVVGDALNKTEAASIHASGIAPQLAETPFVGLYSYLTSGTPAFLGLTESRDRDWPPPVARGTARGDYNPQTWGAALGEPVLDIVPFARAWGPISPFTDVGIVTNVYTWFEPFYRDFREPGVVLGSLMIGAASAACWSRRHASARMLWFSSVLLAVVAFAPFAQKIADTLTLVLVAVIALLAHAHERAPRTALAPPVEQRAFTLR